MGGIISSIFGGGESAPAPAPAPIIQAPAVMPTADDAAIRAAKRRATIKQTQRSGRQSTILSGDNGGIGSSDTLG